MAEDAGQAELVKEQKANCIFCRIVTGEVPGRRVYEDERMLGILDIRPAAKGHVLVMTKEHYPIMPLIPPEEFAHLFGITAAMSGALVEGLLADRCTVFIANGAVAGQQSPHFLFHLIPRELGDGLDCLTIRQKGVPQDEIVPMLSQNLAAVMRQHLAKAGKEHLLLPRPSAPQPVPQHELELAAGEKRPAPAVPGERAAAYDALARLLTENPPLQSLLIDDPAQFELALERQPRFKRLFAGIDIPRLAEHLRKSLPPTPAAEATDEVIPAAAMRIDELFAFIDGKPKLREYLLHDPGTLRRLIPQNERLRKFFDKSDLDVIAAAYKAREAAKEEPSDEDAL